MLGSECAANNFCYRGSNRYWTNIHAALLLSMNSAITGNLYETESKEETDNTLGITPASSPVQNCS